MEGISVNVYRGFRSYWKRRRGYRRLKSAVVERDDGGPGSGQRRRPRWGLKIGRRIRLLRRIGSPRKWLLRIRDAYVKLMLNFANTGLAGGGGFGGSAYVSGLGKGEFKEYDDRVIVEIYKSIVMAQGQFLARDAPKRISSDQSDRRHHHHRVISAG
uniref:Uncharacterized protein n=3 Tax=Opuntia streptacantha TaxID=393608 RepID=A0A7C8Z679_OPUST